MFANNAARIAASVAAEDDAADDAVAPEVLDMAYDQYLNDLAPITRCVCGVSMDGEAKNWI